MYLKTGVSAVCHAGAIGQADAQAAGDADPLFVGQHPDRLASLDAAVLRAAYAKRGGKAGVRAVEIAPTRRQRSPDFLFVFVREAHICVF